MTKHSNRNPIALCLCAILGAFSTHAHVGAPPVSQLRTTLPAAAIQQVILPATDVAAELAADASTKDRSPLRFATPVDVKMTPETDGTWEDLADGRLWRLRVVSSNATDMNFGFTTFRLPEGAALYVIGEDGVYYQGPYTADHNSAQGQLWTAVVPGQAATIELFVPAQAKDQPRLVLTRIGAGYRDFVHTQGGLIKDNEGTCNIDVVCTEGQPWTNEVRSVGVYTWGSIWGCTGTLIADVPRDYRPFFLTASHCGVTAANAASVVVYWNYQSATCGTHGPGSLTQNQSGAVLRAAETNVDFCLLELSRIPDLTYNLYYAGWDRSGVAPAWCVGIHHPAYDVKAISICSNALTTISSCIGTSVNTHWRVLWSAGITQSGSDGSGIWDPNHLLIGTLSRGDNTCGGDLTACYGKFSVAWTNRLSDWLDPQNTGVTNVPGMTAIPFPLVAAASSAVVSEGCSPTNGAVDPGEAVTVSFSLRNIGTRTATNLIATLLSSNGVVSPGEAQTYGMLAVGDAAVARSFAFIASGACGGTISPMFRLQDGTEYIGTVTFNLALGAPVVVSSQNFDAVTIPALPLGWASSPAEKWVTTNDVSDTPTNSAFAPDASSVADYQLITPTIAITSSSATLTFHHYYKTEDGYDGGALEISTDGGAFTDMLAAGGSFISGGYNGTIDPNPSFGNPLAGRSAWTGDSGGFTNTSVKLPSAAAGHNIQLRWRLGCDNGTGELGWHVDTIAVSDGYVCCVEASRPTISDPIYTNQQFQFTVNGSTGSSYAVLVSANPLTPASNWVRLVTNTAPFTFVESNSAAFPARYYRAATP